MAMPLNRRDVLKGALGVFAAWTSSRVLGAQQAFRGGRRLTDQMAVVDGGGSNVLAFSTGDGLVLVDGGVPKSFDKVMASLGANARVNTLFNTHHHLDQTGNNERFSTGTKVIAHKRTLEWMSADHWIQADEHYEKARLKAARPTETFLSTGSLKAGGRADRLRLPTAGPYERRYLRPLQERKRACGGRRGVAAARSRTRLRDRSVDRRPRGCDGCPVGARE
jgi:glyoxylase-like metal-dependent hydrolase (beta-lactamase superfamily II)